jgi:hypothetical protein
MQSQFYQRDLISKMSNDNNLQPEPESTGLNGISANALVPSSMFKSNNIDELFGKGSLLKAELDKKCQEVVFLLDAIEQCGLTTEFQFQKMINPLNGATKWQLSALRVFKECV